MAQKKRNHIPKFGSWDVDNVPYTAYFENARKDKEVGAMMNPNDPQENPDAFMFRGGTGVDKPRFMDNRQKNVTRRSKDSKYTNDMSSSDYSVQQNEWRSNQKKNAYEQPSSFAPPSQGRSGPRHGYDSVDDVSTMRSASVPMFGAWDEKDPQSGESFTVIFQKVKKEKHIASSKFPPIPQQSMTTTPQKKEKPETTTCCRFF